MRWVVLSVVLAGCGGLVYWVSGPRSAARAEGSEAEVAYLCRETREVILGVPREVPAVNPRTGRPTLDRALYCPRCEAWYPVPPTWPGDPQTYPCPKTRGQMWASGPVP